LKKKNNSNPAPAFLREQNSLVKKFFPSNLSLEILSPKLRQQFQYNHTPPTKVTHVTKVTRVTLPSTLFSFNQPR
jgi:hypothetical protein